jgi:hypothetical protein
VRVWSIAIVVAASVLAATAFLFATEEGHSGSALVTPEPEAIIAPQPAEDREQVVVVPVTDAAAPAIDVEDLFQGPAQPLVDIAGADRNGIEVAGTVPMGDPVDPLTGLVPDAPTSMGDVPARAEERTVPVLMALAEKALRGYRLTTPKGDNAYDYYRQVMAFDPVHPGAKRGIRAVANAYADLVEGALRRSDRRDAQRYLRRGLAVDADNSRLRALRTRSARRYRSRTDQPRKDEPQGFRIQR